jgi:hypothetical protein
MSLDVYVEAPDSIGGSSPARDPGADPCRRPGLRQVRLAQRADVYPNLAATIASDSDCSIGGQAPAPGLAVPVP